jgi:hypothetical protein
MVEVVTLKAGEVAVQVEPVAGQTSALEPAGLQFRLVL